MEKLIEIFDRHHLKKLPNYLGHLKGWGIERMVLWARYEWELMQGREEGEVEGNESYMALVNGNNGGHGI